jgi:hypothetical protein
VTSEQPDPLITLFDYDERVMDDQLREDMVEIIHQWDNR